MSPEISPDASDHTERDVPRPELGSPRPPRRGIRRLRSGPALAAIALVLAGGAIGAVAVGVMRPTAQMAPSVPVAINTMNKSGIFTVKGKVAEIYGNKFVLQDDSGRALVETGRAGEGGKLVAKDEPVTVQGRFENGFLRAGFVVHADGQAVALDPPPPPPPGPHGWFRHLVGAAGPADAGPGVGG